MVASGPQPGALTERREERHEKEVRVRDRASEREGTEEVRRFYSGTEELQSFNNGDFIRD